MPAHPYDVKCWQCSNVFMGHCYLPGLEDEICPRCGAGCRGWVQTQEDKVRGTLYYDVGTGLILRSGRERQMLFAHGYYKTKTHGTEIISVDNYGDYTPTA